MAEFELKMWNTATSVKLVKPDGRTVADLVVEDHGRECYIEIVYGKLGNLQVTDKLLYLYYEPDKVDKDE